MKELNSKLDELIKSVEDFTKSNYGPKGMGLYSQKDNINRKAKRTGVEHENVGQNKAEQKFTPSVQGTFAEQAERESKRDKQKSKQNPVKVYTAEEKAALAAKGPAKKEPLARATLDDGDPHDASDKAEKGAKELVGAAGDRAKQTIGAAGGGEWTRKGTAKIGKAAATEDEPKDPLKKPPVSEAQRRAMHAAAAGNSTLGIPKSVGTEFADADKGGKLPEKAKKAVTDPTSPYYKKPRAAESDDGPKITYSKVPGVDPVVSGTQPKKPSTKTPSQVAQQGAQAQTKMRERRTAAGGKDAYESQQQRQVAITAGQAYDRKRQMKKSEVFVNITGEELTKSIRASHSDGEITAMLKAAYDLGKIHHNVCLEWLNWRTLNPSIITDLDNEN